MTARDCWWKHHAGEDTQYVPNNSGRNRRKIETSHTNANVAALREQLRS